MGENIQPENMKRPTEWKNENKKKCRRISTRRVEPDMTITSYQGNGILDFQGNGIPRIRLTRKKRVLCFLFTGFGENKDIEVQFKAMFDSIKVVQNWSDDVTHIVACPPFKHTLKVVCGICKGIPIVSLNFIQNCLQARCLNLLTPDDYLIKPTAQRAQTRLLRNFHSVYIFPSIRNRFLWRTCIEAAGSTLLSTFPPALQRAQGVLILGTEADNAILRRQKKESPMYSFELLRQGLISQNLDFSKHVL